ncbi:MAG TPA: TraB/GumN family protein [Steroidobacteraceae bacterium]|nr:TraB/GumN family protein [Steroidobacteraceae bacterium]
MTRGPALRALAIAAALAGAALAGAALAGAAVRSADAPPAAHTEGTSSQSAHADSAPGQQLDEVLVNGERPGPGLWRVHRGDAQVWILGGMSPLPKDITWRSKQVEQILDGTRMVLVQKPIEIGFARILWLLITQRDLLMVGGGKRLHDVLPARLHERFAVQRAKYTDDANKWERFRPLVAAAFLQQAAFHKVGLSTRVDLGAAMRTLAKKHHVELEEIKIAGVRDIVDAFKTLPPAAENACVEASLATVESGLPRLVDRAQAWANGNVERIEKLAEPAEIDACRAALDTGKGAADLISRVRSTWLGSIEEQLRTGGTTMAVINIDMLIERGGLLDQLRDRGYQVEAPAGAQ